MKIKHKSGVVQHVQGVSICCVGGEMTVLGPKHDLSAWMEAEEDEIVCEANL